MIVQQPCRRRAIWAAQAVIPGEPHGEEKAAEKVLTPVKLDAGERLPPVKEENRAGFDCPKCKRHFTQGKPRLHLKYCRGL